MKLITLKRRGEFIEAARSPKSRKWVTPTVLIQVFPYLSDHHDGETVYVGFTATRKLGSAVIRNRVRRRLRSAVSKLIPEYAVPGYAYVFVGRAATADCPYQCLLEDLKRALIKLQPKRAQAGRAAASKAAKEPHVRR